VHGLELSSGGHVGGGQLVELLLAGALTRHVARARGRPVPGTETTFIHLKQFAASGNSASLVGSASREE
jgi:hypothetical protein